MSRRWRNLLILVTVAAVAVSLLARLPRRAAAPEAPPPALPAADLVLTVRDGAVEPETSAVPKDRRVRLVIRNQGTRAASLRLAGYEGRLDIPVVPAGGSWTGEFESTLPGEGFSWMLDGEPAGRVAVTGSHLPEGHR